VYQPQLNIFASIACVAACSRSRCTLVLLSFLLRISSFALKSNWVHHNKPPISRICFTANCLESIVRFRTSTDTRSWFPDSRPSVLVITLGALPSFDYSQSSLPYVRAFNNPTHLCQETCPVGLILSHPHPPCLNPSSRARGAPLPQKATVSPTSSPVAPSPLAPSKPLPLCSRTKLLLLGSLLLLVCLPSLSQPRALAIPTASMPQQPLSSSLSRPRRSTVRSVPTLSLALSSTQVIDTLASLMESLFRPLSKMSLLTISFSPLTSAT
jgi:hypothetical protein